MTRPGGASGADRPVTGTGRRGVPWDPDTTNDPNVSGPVDRRDPAMRCSQPGGASKPATAGSPEMDAMTVPAVESADATWRLNPSKASVVQAVGRRMVPYL